MRKDKKFSGQSLVEFSLLLPILLVLVMGLFDIGRAVLYYAVLNTAVREGTRLAIVQPASDYQAQETYTVVCPASSTADSKVCNEIQNKLFNIADLASSTITINHKKDCDCDGDGTCEVDCPGNGDPVINIGIEFAYQPITPGLGLIGDFIMNVNSQMYITPLVKY